MKILLVPSIILLVFCISVGAFNLTSGTNNRPYTVYEMLGALSKLNIDFEVSTETLDTLKTHFENFNDDSYKLSEEYFNASFFEKLFENWKRNSVIIRIVTYTLDIVSIVVGFVIDLLILLTELFTFGYRLIRGVPI